MTKNLNKIYDLVKRAKAENRDITEEELKELFKVMYREKGKVKIMEFMERGHCGYYRALRIIREMGKNTEKMGVSIN